MILLCLDFILVLDMLTVKQLIKDNKSDINAQVQEIVAEWYNQPPHPTWNEVVEALHKHGLVNDAVDLASKVGVKSLVPQEDGYH